MDIPVMRPENGKLSDIEDLNNIVQLKYDGTYTILIKKGTNISMVGRSWISDYTKNHPEFVIDALKLPWKNCILSGELVFFDNDGQDHFLTALATQKTWKEKEYVSKYMIFDILEIDKPLYDKSFMFRDSILEILFGTTSFNTFEKVYSYKTLEEKQNAWEISNEGIVIKNIYSTIKDGQTKEWKKLKKLKSDDFWCIGLTKGKGRREATFGAMLLANKIGETYEYITKTSGFTDEKLHYFLDKLVPTENIIVTGKLPKGVMYLCEPVLVEVKYQRKTEIGKLIMPRFLKERIDLTG